MRIAPTPAVPRRTAFVDGVRRGEGLLYRMDADGELVRGTVGAFACGAVLCVAGQRPVYGPIQTERSVIFGAGVSQSLPPAEGYDWRAASIGSVEPDAPLAELQEQMRAAEGQLAVRLARDGWLTVVDGTLRFVGSRDLPVVGLVEDASSPTTRARRACSSRRFCSAGSAPPCSSTTSGTRATCGSRCRAHGRAPVRDRAVGTAESAGLEVARETVDEVAASFQGTRGSCIANAPRRIAAGRSAREATSRRLGPVRLASRAAGSLSTSTTSRCPCEVRDWAYTGRPIRGFAQERSAEHGDGEPREIPAGAFCEIDSIDQTTGWVTIHFDLVDSGPKQPFRVEAIVDAEILVVEPRPALLPIIPEGTESPI